MPWTSPIAFQRQGLIAKTLKDTHNAHSRPSLSCRGVNTWKPQVTPLAEVKTTPEGIPVATATSLAANKQVSCRGDRWRLHLASKTMD